MLNLLAISNAIDIAAAFQVGCIQAAIAAISMFSIPQHSKKLTS